MGDPRGCRGGLRRGLRRCRAAPPLPLVVLPPDGVSTLRYARGPVPPKRRAAAHIGFAPFPLPPPPLAQLASSAGGKSLRARCGVPLRPPVPLLRRLARQRRAPPLRPRPPVLAPGRGYFVFAAAGLGIAPPAGGAKGLPSCTRCAIGCGVHGFAMNPCESSPLATAPYYREARVTLLRRQTACEIAALLALAALRSAAVDGN